MEWYWAFALLIGLVVGLMFMGIPVAFAFFGANIVGALVFLGGQAGLEQLVYNIVEGLVTFSLAPIMMFVLMGEIMFQTGVASRAIEAVEKLIARVPGRLSIVSVLGGTVFASLSGSSMASTALLATTLMPEMRRRGYHKHMAMGPIMGTGGIAMLIPPSGMAVLLGSLSGISIAGVLIAAAIPGLLVALFHLTYVVVRCWMNPSLAPTYDVPRLPLIERVKPFAIYVLPLLSLFVVVVGSILSGFATPTESAALGALGALGAASGYRSLTWKGLQKALVESGKIVVMIFFIIAASLTFSQVLAFSGATYGLLSLMRDLDPSPTMLIWGMMVIMLVLGCLMDPLSILLITLPFFMPLAELAGFPMVWFGVLMLLTLEIGQTTPPFGMILFCMKGLAPPDTSMRDIYVSVTPFILNEVAVLALLIAVPAIVTWLPALIRGG